MAVMLGVGAIRCPPLLFLFTRSLSGRLPLLHPPRNSRTLTAAADHVQQEDPKAAFLKVKRLSANAVLPATTSPAPWPRWCRRGARRSSPPTSPSPSRRAPTPASVPTTYSSFLTSSSRCALNLFDGMRASNCAAVGAIDVGAGVVDADYRGPVGVVLFNHSDADLVVSPGDRVAPDVAEVDVRGGGGFGSTGV